MQKIMNNFVLYIFTIASFFFIFNLITLILHMLQTLFYFYVIMLIWCYTKSLERRNFMQNNKPPKRSSFASRLKNSLLNDTLGGLLLLLIIPLIVIAILVCAFTSCSVIVKILITILLYIGILACVSLCAILVSIFTNNK